MAEIKNSESDMSTQQKAELDKEKRKEEKKEAKRAKRQHYRELNEPPKLTVFLWNITDIDVSYELPVSLIQIRASSQAYLEKI